MHSATFIDNIKLIIVKDKNKGGELVASLIQHFLKYKKKSVFGLATGETMIPIYANLKKLYRKRRINFSYVKTFNLDEYIGLNINDKESLRRFMDTNFFDYVNIRKVNIGFLDGKAKDSKKECKKYEKKIEGAGGIDLQILGIGRDGHIGFNEPGSSIKSKTRKVKLSATTKKDNKSFFKLSKVPDYALTIGISNILQAKQIVLIAFGKNKSKAINLAINGKISNKIPASFLRKHPNVTLVLDKSAASQLLKNNK